MGRPPGSTNPKGHTAGGRRKNAGRPKNALPTQRNTLLTMFGTSNNISTNSTNNHPINAENNQENNENNTAQNNENNAT